MPIASSSQRGARSLAGRLVAVLAVVAATLFLVVPPSADAAGPRRPLGPCDIYGAAGTPCVAAHSTTRALFRSYDGPLYQVQRLSDGATRDIGVVAPRKRPVRDAGGYADAGVQDRFCARTTCFIVTLYDQTDNHNDLTQAPRGGFSGPAKGGFDNLPIADQAPISVNAHKVYGVFIAPGMGLRDNDTNGIAVDDEPEGMYWVVDGTHFNAGCCYDYGNAEIDSRDDGNGTMETTYFGNSTGWYRGNPPGPWIMTDQENNLVGCVNPGSDSKLCPELTNVKNRFVTATAKGKAHRWATLGGDAQAGPLRTEFDGPRIDDTYDPMRKQGAIVLGNGGDNSNSSQGTFYEGVMTDGYPSDATDQAVQANVVAARYDVASLRLAPASAVDAPTGLQTFTPGGSQRVTETYTNTTGARVAGVRLGLTPPAGWSAVVAGTRRTSQRFDSVAAGASVSATFRVTSARRSVNGDLVGTVAWTRPDDGRTVTERTTEKVRSTGPVKINEFRAGTKANATDAYVELVNTGSKAVDLSSWSLTEHAAQLPVASSVAIGRGTRLAPGAHYVLGLSTSGLAAPTRKKDLTVHLRSTTGLAEGRRVVVDTGRAKETRTVLDLGTAASPSTPLWQPVPDGPVITVPRGSENVPVTSTAGFVVGQQVGLGYGAGYDQATVTAVGKPGTQALLSAPARAGDTTLKVSESRNISVGDRIRLDIDDRIETVQVAAVGTPGADGTGLTLTAPLRFDHASNLPFSDRGTGVSFTPATRHAHASNDPVQPLGSGVTLDRPLTRAHAVDAPVVDPKASGAGYTGDRAPDQWFGGPALSPNAGSMALRDARGKVADSLNYGLLVDPWLAEGYQGESGATAAGCRVTAPGLGKSAGRLPDGVDTDSNCTDFSTSNNPTPGGANRGLTLDEGPRVSLHGATAGDTAGFVTHGSDDDLVRTADVSASSPVAQQEAATFVRAAGLADPSCYSFESVDQPGSYLRHTGYQFHLQVDDGSTLFSQDATFCEVKGNSGTGVSYRSVNFPDRYIRAYQGFVYLASNGGPFAWDNPTGWAEDTSWAVEDPWAPGS